MRISPLLSLDESQERATNLVCWSAAQRLRVLARLLQIFDQWRADWGVTAPAVTVNTESLAAEQARRVLAFQIFGVAEDIATTAAAYSQSSVAQSVVDDAWADWIGRLEDTTGVAIVDAREAALKRPWNGYMQIHLPWWDGIFEFGLEPKAVRQLLGIAHIAKPADIPVLPGIVPLYTAVANESVRMEVHCEPVSLTLGQIQSLRFGDVVALNHRLNEPMAVMQQGIAAPMQPFCRAWLGQREGQIAIELDQ